VQLHKEHRIRHYTKVQMKEQGSRNRTIVFTGGGTGGHVYPGLVVLKKLQAFWPGELIWIGSSQGMERSLVEKEGVPFIGIPSGKFRRDLSWKNIPDVFRVLGGFFAAIYHLKRLKPILLFSKGGYVSVPPILAAAILKIPIIGHESDLDPGLATRIGLPFVRKLLVPYPDSVEQYAPRFRSKIVVTGNPVREEILQGSIEEGRKLLGLTEGKPVLLVLGGSQGAQELNELVWSVLKELLSTFQVVHQVGASHAQAPELASVSQLPGYFPRPYFTGELPHVLAAADMVVSRAGAGTLWELAAIGKPSLLIPLRGSGTRGDQVRNARLFELNGWAKVLYDTPILPEQFLQAVRSLMEGGSSEAIRKNLSRLDARGSLERILSLLKEEVEQIAWNGTV
jgi:UDP-N-acetylglucosamine--N-acetylmuramyl-(pentapeptide) pyrophosphoryl-undecaprenol N-acetylglucosamine transferase